MESKFYQADEHRAEKVQELFARIARRYDLLNDVMSAGLHRRWKRRLAELARREKIVEGGRGKGREVLDLCCGTGDIALRFAHQGARVTGVDFTEEMLQVAKARERRGPVHPESFRDSPRAAGTPNAPVAVRPRPRSRGKKRGPPTRGDVTWVRADALRLPFRDNSFDVVSVGYGLRNLADIEQGLREILRVLRPGGKLLSLDFGKPEAKAFRRLYFGYLQTVLPMLGRIFCGDPDTHGYILASLPDYPAQRGIRELMESIGYGECGFEEYCLGAMAINYGMKPAPMQESGQAR